MGWTKTVMTLLMTSLHQGSLFHPGQKVFNDLLTLQYT